MPKIKTIIVILLVLAMLGAVFYLFTVNNNRPELPDEVGQVVEEATSPTDSSLLGSVLGRSVKEPFRRLVARPVLAPAVAPDGQTFWFFEAGSGRLFEIPSGGQREQVVSDISIPNLKSVSLAPDLSKAILETSNELFLQDYQSGQVFAFNTNVTNPIFSPNGDQITWACETGICTAKPDGTKEKTILPLSLKQLNLTWDDTIYFYGQPSALADSPVFSVSQGTGRLQRVLSALPGLIFKTKAGQKLYSTRDQLYLNEVELDLKTFASKCAFSSWLDLAYCAVPVRLDPNQLWPDYYLKDQVKTRDAIYQIDLTKNDQADYLTTKLHQTALDIKTIIPAKDRLYLLENQTNSIYVLELRD